MMIESTQTGPDHEAQDSLVRILITDVLSAQKRLREEASQSNRRDLIRCAFAAIEGMLWLYCGHVGSVAKTMDEISSAEAMALAQLSYHVTEQGEVKDQVRYLPMTTAIRLATRIAQRINPRLEVDYDAMGWCKFRDAVAVRNRITHPKSRTDLTISDADTAVCLGALHWTLETAALAMASTNSAFTEQTAGMRDVFTRLEHGDSAIWKLYRSFLASTED